MGADVALKCNGVANRSCNNFFDSSTASRTDLPFANWAVIAAE